VSAQPVRGVEESYTLYRRQSADNRGSFSQPKNRPRNGASPACRPTGEQAASCCRSGWV